MYVSILTHVHSYMYSQMCACIFFKGRSAGEKSQKNKEGKIEILDALRL